MRKIIANSSGITLIALVVTIVVLLILAGITIQLVLNDGGIFNQAQRSKEQTRIGELLDKFNVSEATVALEKLGKPSLEDFINQVQNKEGYVIEAENQEEGYYQVTTEDGYVFDVSIIEGTTTNDIIIEYVGKAENLPPAIKVKNVTTNSAEIEVIRIEGITNYKYEYKKHGEENYQIATGNNNTCTLTNLTSNTIYDVKVTVTKEGKEIVLEKQIAIGKIPTGGTIKLRNVTWSNNKATAVVYHEETRSYKIEWKKEETTSEIWNSGEMGEKEISISNLNHGDMVLLRLNDGTSSGDEASMSIIDDKEPQQASISFNPETAQAGQDVIATVILLDNESGINLANSRYEFNESNELIGTEDTLYTGNFANGATITVTGNSAGNWYLHVLSVDNAGNKLETVSQKIEITQTEIGAFNRSIGEVEIAFVNINNEPISVNNIPTPILGEGMVPVKWNEQEQSWYVCQSTDNSWYSYAEADKKWANVMLRDGLVVEGIADMATASLAEMAEKKVTTMGSMFVYVPRYSYKILYKDAQGNTIGYSDSDGITDVNGNIVTGTKKQGAVEVKGSLDGKEIEKYVLHPAFQKFETDELNMKNGGWEKELAGIWVAKFEASQVNNTTTLKVLPTVSAWNCITMNNAFTYCSNYNSLLKSHLTKNSEWGAVAYLTKSRYGANEKVWINPDFSGNITGRVGTTPDTSWTSNCEEYNSNNGRKGSTTGTIYGIYDMCGGNWEYVAAYINNGNSYLLQKSTSLVNNEKSYLKQVYNVASSDTQSNNYLANAGVYGDAVYETSTNALETKTSWYKEHSAYPVTYGAHFLRGGGATDKGDAGLLAFSYDHRNHSNTFPFGFRPVLCVQ